MKNLVPVTLFFCLILCMHTNRIIAQAPTADHIALYVYDLDKSAEFYKTVMQLEVVPEPFHDNRHVWLKIGEHTRLHLIKGAATVKEGDINSHVAYHVPVLQKFITHLEELKVKYGSFKGEPKTITPRPDGVKQIYLQDPDNNWIEVNDDKR